MMSKSKSEAAGGLQEESPMSVDMTREQRETPQAIWQTFLQTGGETAQPQEHLTDALLYDLAVGELSAEQRPVVLEHLADCAACCRRLVDLQAAIATDREVRAVWTPKILRAAGGTQSPSVIKDLTEDGKYLITLQPTRDGQQDLLTLEVTSSFQQSLEGRKIIVVSAKGTVILHGTVSGGNITRLINRQLREEWPFWVHAG